MINYKEIYMYIRKKNYSIKEINIELNYGHDTLRKKLIGIRPFKERDYIKVINYLMEKTNKSIDELENEILGIENAL